MKKHNWKQETLKIEESVCLGKDVSGKKRNSGAKGSQSLSSGSSVLLVSEQILPQGYSGVAAQKQIPK